jgi:hypothetical protein
MLSKAHCDERRSLWYNNGRTKPILSMASRDLTIDTRWDLIAKYYEFAEYNIKWFLHFMKNIDLYKRSYLQDFK